MMEAVEGRTLLSTFTVTNTNDTGAGSLRQAILDANKTTAVDTIKFAIGSGAKTISPKSRLPGISQPALLDATTQPGFSGKPIIELNGSSAGGVEGLKITGGGVTIKGFVINRFAGSGIFIYKGTGNNKIVGNWIGVDKNGTAAATNSGHGIICQSQNNTIGGTTAADRNVISGNEHDGVLMVTTGSRNNTVQGNYIGTNAAGTGALGNGWYGVEISQHDNVVGGTTPAARNIISASGYDGVVFYLSTGYNNVCQGNYIGTDYTGTKDLGNKGVGVCATNGACNNTIGGSTSASRNVIAGNDGSAIGMYYASNNNKVQNNWLGIGATGMALPNAKSGVLLIACNNTSISGNTIACCGTYNPVQINSGSGTTQASNTLYAKVTAGLRIV
jgi:hypothetical protein